MSKHSRQRGASAVELAIVLSVSIVLMPAVALFARVFFQYSVVKEATRDAAAYLGTLPEAALRDPDEFARAVTVAESIVNHAAAESGLSSANSNARLYELVITCDDSVCMNDRPEMFDVRTGFSIQDATFSALTGGWTGAADRTWRVPVRTSMPYAN